MVTQTYPTDLKSGTITEDRTWVSDGTRWVSAAEAPGLPSPDGHYLSNGETWVDAPAMPVSAPAPRPTAVPPAAPRSDSPASESDPMPRFMDDGVVGGGGGVLDRLFPGRRKRADALRQQVEKIRTRVPADGRSRHIAILSAKGGVGKTTTTILAASTIGQHRHDPVITVECNPHHGTFRSHLADYNDASILDLLNFLETNERRGFRDIDVSKSYLDQFFTPAHDLSLNALLAPADPTMARQLVSDDYARLFGVLDRYSRILMLDMGTGLMDDATLWIVREVVDQVVIVVNTAQDGADLGKHTLQFLVNWRGAEWVKKRAVLVLNEVSQRVDQRASRKMVDYFEPSVRRVMGVRWDSHLAKGARVSWTSISNETRSDYMALAAELGSGLSLPYVEPVRVPT